MSRIVSSSHLYLARNTYARGLLYFHHGLLGHYEDSLVHAQGRWKFLKRAVYSDIPADDSLSRQ